MRDNYCNYCLSNPGLWRLDWPLSSEMDVLHWAKEVRSHNTFWWSVRQPRLTDYQLSNVWNVLKRAAIISVSYYTEGTAETRSWLNANLLFKAQRGTITRQLIDTDQNWEKKGARRARERKVSTRWTRRFTDKMTHFLKRLDAKSEHLYNKQISVINQICTRKNLG